MIVVALVTTSRSLSDKLYHRLKRAINNPSIMSASFQYPAQKAAKILGWDGKFDPRGRKLITTVYAAGEEYDRDQFIKKMETLLNTTHKSSVIVSDVKTKRQIDMLQSVPGVKLIVCGDSISECDGVIKVYAGDGDIDSIVRKIIKKIKEIR